jgi:hypothetical protein
VVGCTGVAGQKLAGEHIKIIISTCYINIKNAGEYLEKCHLMELIIYNFVPGK